MLTLRARVDYLAARLHEQKFENLQLRTLTRESAGLRERLAEMEKQLLEFRAVRGHPLLGPVVKCCLEGLHMKGGGSSQTGNESSAKAIGTSQHSASQRSAKLMAEEGLDPDDRQDISSRCIRCLTWMSPPVRGEHKRFKPIVVIFCRPFRVLVATHSYARNAFNREDCAR